jgi:hypothetical protein
MKATVNDPVRELKAVLAEHLPWQGARISFLAHFLLALFKVRSVNLAELALSTGQKPQSPEEILEFLGEVKDDVTEEIKAVPEEGLKGPLKGFFKGMG